MYKKIAVVCLLLCIISAGLLFAGGKKETTPQTETVEEAPAVVEEAPAAAEAPSAAAEPVADVPKKEPIDPVTVNMAVFKGPTGFGFVRLIEDGADLVDGIKVETEILPSPTEAIARLTSGEADVVAMPVNTAAAIYNKGVDVRLAAITGEGMLYLMSSYPGGTSDPESFRGRTINIPGAGSSPEYVTKYVFEKSGIAPGSGIDFDFSLNVASQLAQMVIAKKVESAVLPEPFATMVAMKNPEVKRVMDLQSAWSSLSGQGNYPMTALLIRGKFLEDHPRVSAIMQMAVSDSIAWVNENPKEAALLIEKHGILTAALAEPAIPNCNLVYIDAMDAKKSIEAYLSVLKSYDAASIGGDLPDEAFYLAK